MSNLYPRYLSAVGVGLSNPVGPLHVQLNNNSNALVVNNNACVGIGKSNAAYPLDVSGDINFTGALRSNGVIYAPASSQFSTLNGSNVALLGGSNLAIGKSNAAYALDVVGDVNFSGSLRSNGSLYVGSQFATIGGSNIALLGGSNLAIGKSNASYAVDVVGDVNVSGNFKVGGSNISLSTRNWNFMQYDEYGTGTTWFQKAIGVWVVGTAKSTSDAPLFTTITTTGEAFIKIDVSTMAEFNSGTVDYDAGFIIAKGTTSTNLVPLYTSTTATSKTTSVTTSNYSSVSTAPVQTIYNRLHIVNNFPDNERDSTPQSHGCSFVDKVSSAGTYYYAVIPTPSYAIGNVTMNGAYNVGEGNYEKGPSSIYVEEVSSGAGGGGLVSQDPVDVVLTSSQSWTPPAGVTSFTIEMVGGGGKGGDFGSGAGSGGGGGAGAFFRAVVPVSSGALSCTINGAGSTSTFTYGTRGATCGAGGVGGNGSSSTTGIGGIGGSVSGVTGFASYLFVKGGDGAVGGTYVTGFNSTGGLGGSSYFGGGGRGSQASTGSDFNNPGSAYGSGGGGAIGGNSSTGSNGAPGVVMITYLQPNGIPNNYTATAPLSMSGTTLSVANATTSAPGVVQVGSGLSILNGVLSAGMPTGVFVIQKLAGSESVTVLSGVGPTSVTVALQNSLYCYKCTFNSLPKGASTFVNVTGSIYLGVDGPNYYGSISAATAGYSTMTPSSTSFNVYRNSGGWGTLADSTYMIITYY